MGKANGFNFNRFKSEMRNPARGNQFRIDIFAPLEIRSLIPDYSNLEQAIPFRAKGGVIPALNLDELELSFGGRKLKIAGDRTLEPWTAQIYLTHGLPERKFFEAWQDAIVGVDCADRAPSGDTDYFADANVFQLNQNGEVGAQYTFESIWPNSIGEVTFDSENSELLIMDVTFSINNIATTGIRDRTNA